ncbi:hypothetical protein GCM10011532_24790 [Christiangramia forsetii]|nr:hypothetical protein GCM10011532_24790 [Christiangramia forsetii]
MQAQLPSPPEGKRWIINEPYSDEFNGTELDKNKWYDSHPYWTGRAPAMFLPSQVSTENGNLKIQNTKLEKDSIVYNEWNDTYTTYTIGGGAVVSKAQKAHYGYYEVRMKASKISMSSTFWLKNLAVSDGCTSSKTELDIIEAIGGAKRFPGFSTQMKSNTHIFHKDCNGVETDYAVGANGDIGGNAADAYHTYGAWWRDPNNIDFYIDGEYSHSIQPSTQTDPTPFDRPMWINMVTETYDWEILPTDEELADDSRNTTYYDYVRAYSLVDVDEKPQGGALLINGGFETGDFTGWIGWGGNPKEVVNNNQYAGNYAVHIVGGGAPEQVVTLKPNTQYNLSAYAKVLSGDIVLGIKQNQGGAVVGSVAFTASEYTQKSFTFTTGSDANLKVYFFAQPGEEAYGDEFALTEVGSGTSEQGSMPLEESIGYYQSPEYQQESTSISAKIEYKASIERDLVFQLLNASGEIVQELNGNALAGFGKKKVMLELENPIDLNKEYNLKTQLVSAGETPVVVDEITEAVRLPIPEVIAFAKTPDTLEIQDNYSFDIAYTARESRDIVVEIWSSPTQWMASKKVNVPAGKDTVQVNIQLNNLPEVGNDYVLKSSLRPVGGDWRTNITIEELRNIVMIEPKIPATGISIGIHETILKVGDTLTIPVTISPEDATDKDFSWEISDENILNIDSEGIFSATAGGTAFVKAIASDGDFTDSTKVQVQGPFTEIALPSVIQAEDYDLGGENAAYLDLSAGNSGGVFRTDDVDITPTSDLSGDYHITDFENGEWLEYTVNVTTGGNYYFSARIASTVSSTLQLKIADISKILSIPNTNGKWQTLALTLPLAISSGEKVLQISMKGGSFNLNYVQFGAVPAVCEGVADWNVQTIYSDAGTEVIYNGLRYSNKHYTTEAPGTGNAWIFEGYCGAAKPDCFDLPSWSATNVYPDAGTEIVYNGNLYSNKWHASTGKEPGNSKVWEFIGPCSSSSQNTTPTTCPENASVWNPKAVYKETGSLVIFNGTLYSNKWYASAGREPGKANVWKIERACTSIESTSKVSMTIEKSGMGEAILEDEAFKMYPNPLQSQVLNLAFSEDFGKAELTIVNMAGTSIFEKIIEADGILSVDLEKTYLLDGLYILKVKTETRSFTHKLIVKR